MSHIFFQKPSTNYLFQLWRAALFGAFGVSLSACGTVSYYTQSVSGHLSLWWSAKKIDTLIDNRSVDEKTSQKLKTALEVREYASRKLLLPNNDSYTYYADLGRPYVVWNVFAADEFSVEAKRWCYLIVGCVGYRGYYDENEAKVYAADLQQQHYDVYTSGVSAYSTLGWFADPLLNTMLGWNDRAIASLMFHELSHQVIYIKGDSDFNEAFATAVEQIGTVYWLRDTRPDMLIDYVAAVKQQLAFRDLLLATRAKLQQLYAQRDIGDEEKRTRKSQIISQLKDDYNQIKLLWHKPNLYDSWFEKPINNARLSSTMTYLENVPAFLALFQQQQGDWQRFFDKVKSFEDLDAQTRKALIQSLISQNVELSALAASLP